MSMIVMPNGMPIGKKRQPLTREEVKLVTTFEAWCRSRGLAMDLLCSECLDAGEGPNARCYGDNVRDATTYHINCAHAERVYGAV